MPIQSIYIHIPFCLSRCGYCDFYSSTIRDPNVRADYLQAVLTEARYYRNVLAMTAPIRTLYLGGGTPSIYDGTALYRFLSELRAEFSWFKEAEITMEANPGTLSPEKLALFREAGVNRISLGVQSFDPATLQLLERTHSVEDVYRAVEMIREAGFANVSLDLIFATPDQTLEKWQWDVQHAVELNPEHLSTYNLTYVEGTPFFERLQKGALDKLDPDLEADMFEWTIAFLTEAGFTHYEISNFCRPGYACVHNERCWRFHDYLGLGVSAHTFVDDRRRANVAHLNLYLQSLARREMPVDFVEEPARQTRMGEMLFMGLRTKKGLKLADFEARFGESVFSVFGEMIDAHRENGWLVVSDGFLRFTHKGMLLADSLFSDLL